MRTRDDSGMFSGGQFSILDFAFFVGFYQLDNLSNFMGLGKNSKGARYMEFLFRGSANRKLS